MIHYLKKVILIVTVLAGVAPLTLEGSSFGQRKEKISQNEQDLEDLISTFSFLDKQYVLYYYFNSETDIYTIISTKDTGVQYSVKPENDTERNALIRRLQPYNNVFKYETIETLKTAADDLEPFSSEYKVYYMAGPEKDSYTIFSEAQPNTKYTVSAVHGQTRTAQDKGILARIFDKSLTDSGQNLRISSSYFEAERLKVKSAFNKQKNLDSGGPKAATAAAAASTTAQTNNDDGLDWGDDDDQAATAATAPSMATSGITLTTPSAKTGLSACPANNVQFPSAAASEQFVPSEPATQEVLENTESTTGTNNTDELKFLDDQYTLHWATILNENRVKTFACFSTYDNELHTFTKDNSAFSNAILARIKKNVNSTKHTDYNAFTAALKALQHEQTATATTSQRASQNKKPTLQEQFREEDAQYVIEETTADMKYWIVAGPICRRGPIILLEDGQVCYTKKAVELYESHLASTGKHLFPAHLLPIFQAFNNKKSYPQGANVGPEYLAKNWENSRETDKSEDAFRERARQLKAAWAESIAAADINRERLLQQQLEQQQQQHTLLQHQKESLNNTQATHNNNNNNNNSCVLNPSKGRSNDESALNRTPLFENYLQATLLASIAAAASYSTKDARMLVLAAPIIAFSYREKEDQIDYSAWLRALEKRYNDFVNRHPEAPKRILRGASIATASVCVGYGASWYTGRFAERLPFMKTVFAPACDIVAEKIVNPAIKSASNWWTTKAIEESITKIPEKSIVL